MKVHAAIAKALADHGVDTMFGLIGDANLYMADSFVRDQGGTFVSSSNEAGATLMALGYACVSDRIGVATVTLGPGLVNTIASLVEGVRGATPMVLLAGDTGRLDRHDLSNVDQREFVAAAGAGFEQLRGAETVAEDVATAFRRAAVERRPVVLNMPTDLQWLDADYRRMALRVPDNRAFAPSSADLDDAIGIIAAARRPIVLAGRGAVAPAAKAALLKLAARIEAPLATTLKATGLFRGESCDLGICGTLSSPEAADIILSSDCIIAFGASLNFYTTSHGAFLKGKRLVQVNLERRDIGRHAWPDVGIAGDPALVAEKILYWLDEAEIAPSGFSGQLPRPGLASSAISGGEGESLNVRHALARLNKAVPDDRILVTDGGRFLAAAWRDVDVRDPQSFVFTLNFGAIGMGLSQAIGCALAAPERPILLVTGDGGFMLGGLAEFNTAVRHGCDLIVVICNDGSYGAEHVQFRAKDMDPRLSLFDWPDFARVADALGGRGVTVRTVEDLDDAALAIAERDRPLLIDIKLDPDRMPPLAQ